MNQNPLPDPPPFAGANRGGDTDTPPLSENFPTWEGLEVNTRSNPQNEIRANSRYSAYGRNSCEYCTPMGAAAISAAAISAARPSNQLRASTNMSATLKVPHSRAGNRNQNSWRPARKR